MKLPFFSKSLRSGRARAECPGRANLEKGIRLTNKGVCQSDVGGSIETWQAGPEPDVVTLITQFEWSDEERSQVLLQHGIYLLHAQDFWEDEPQPGTVATYDYSIGRENLPVPTPDAAWDLDVVVTSDDGPISETHRWRFDQETTLDIGPCRYRAIPASVQYREGTRNFMNYLPDLGFAIDAGYQSENGRYEYEFTKIEAIE